MTTTRTISPGLERVVRTALTEDLGLGGDLTTRLTVPGDAAGTAYIVSREEGVLSGDEAATATFTAVDPTLQIDWAKQAGDKLATGDLVATISGSARSVLTAERTALNLLGHLTGIASRTSIFVDLVDGTKARIVDTRKTTPGLRELEKQAVLDGGGTNHRFGLYDAVLVKDNHIGLGGGLLPVLDRLAAGGGHLVRVEIEVDTIEQLDTVLAFDAERISEGLAPVVHAVLLDNMEAWQVATGVSHIRRHPAPLVAEVSGGVNEETVQELARAGADAISVGAITHSVTCHDFGLDLQA
ncbi:nicotinate-nucleotide pyrophosphorylase [carboxylating] [Flexivirga endophytica]|uniref:Nicotinate-nucleotide pyrophosphorylase [carboxylating] n=1 Tax=Flexivirga endophytica TaxID=1849103 RepID=A0A916WX76_9MICO|nr:carboxylating nicotinate-nucleotide diphosphorylase [Flexivirga endophytica]GGB40988.1 nicotinate-nucleotide pyrophosphorylase [carboxylating] [Flexivirga endophytica]GHB48788.1 nicotinate-nucleotide pyrophosphorylase [carboxylating] [Flexivirga endophytica]